MRKSGIWIFITILLVIANGCSSVPQTKEPQEVSAISIVGTGGKRGNIPRRNWGYVLTGQNQEAGTISEDEVYEKNGCTVQASIERPKGFQPRYEKLLNAEIDKLTDKAVEILKKEKPEGNGWVIYAGNSLSFYGPYASITGNYQWGLNSDSYPENRLIQETVVYDMAQNKEVSLPELFVDGVDYMKLINDAIKESMDFNAQLYGIDEENILKRPFTGFVPSEISFYFSNNPGEKYTPYLVIRPTANNRFMKPYQHQYIPLEKLQENMIVNPDDILNFLMPDATYSRCLIDSEKQLELEYVKKFQQEIGDTIGLVQFKALPDTKVKDKINETLLQEYEAMLSEKEPEQTGNAKTSWCSVIGPFFTTTYGNDWSSIGYVNRVFDLSTGEKMKIRDLVKTDSIEQMSEIQKRFLDNDNFNLSYTGDIFCNDEEGNTVSYSEEFFDFDKFADTNFKL